MSAPVTGPAPFRILVVCVGNVCRSPLAERLLAARLPESYDVSSAGVAALVGSPMDPPAAEELRTLGGSADGFVARQLVADLVTRADLVLTATLGVRSRVLEDHPAALRRTFTLLELAALTEHLDLADESQGLRYGVRRAAAERTRVAGLLLDVADPYRQGPDAQRVAATAIHEAVDRLAQALPRLTAGSPIPGG